MAGGCISFAFSGSRILVCALTSSNSHPRHEKQWDAVATAARGLYTTSLSSQPIMFSSRHD